MATAVTQRIADAGEPELFAAIGQFLADHRLSPDPAHYAFAYRIVRDPLGPLARTVKAMTDGGVRLTTQDVATLGGNGDAPSGANDDGDGPADLVAKASEQMRGFAELIERMQTQTSDFGRDLAASVDALAPVVTPELVRLTAAMLDRVREAETQIEAANSESAALREELEAARGDARCDALTGLPNRRALIEDFNQGAASDAPLCLAVCDIDHFKRINDRFGHPVGDRVLRAIAGVLADTCGGAFVTRYGGEEFGVLFSGAGIDQAVETLDRARAIVAGKTYRRRDDDTPLGTITFSAGVVEVRESEDFDDAFARADALLYAAKDGGRNQIRH